MAEISQVFTVEYLVPGRLDGVTPSPAFSVDRSAENFKQSDPDGVFRFDADEMQSLTGGDLGLLDLTTPFDGTQNLFANRLVTWFYLDAPGAPGAGGAAVDSVDVRDGVVTRQILHAALTGREDFFGTGFFVPQGSRLRVDGFTAAAEPILVRANVNLFETVEELLLALNQVQSLVIGAQFSAFLGVTTAIPGAALTPMPLDTLDFAFDPLVYTHTLGSSDITIVQSGRYHISAQASIDNTVGAARTSSAAALFVNSGAGFMLVLGSLTFGYHRNAANGEDTLPDDKILTLNAGDILRFAAARIAGTGPLAYIGGGCRLSITKVPEF
jgi:hypothetical protein